jgi:hypothetical protein
MGQAKKESITIARFAADGASVDFALSEEDAGGATPETVMSSQVKPTGPVSLVDLLLLGRRGSLHVSFLARLTICRSRLAR